MLVGRAIPDHVVAQMAGTQIVVGAGHRVTQHLLARRQTEGHVTEDIAMHIARHRAFGNQRAPRHIAGIERIAAGRAQAPHGRADTVGADQEIGALARAIGKNRSDALAVLLERSQRSAAMVMRRRKGIAQDAIDPLPGRHHLRAFGLQRHAALGIEHAPFLHRHAKFARAQTEIGQNGENFRLRHDAGAAAGQFAFDLFVNIDLPSGRLQHQPGKQAAHRAADDDGAALALIFRNTGWHWR